MRYVFFTLILVINISAMHDDNISLVSECLAYLKRANLTACAALSQKISSLLPHTNELLTLAQATHDLHVIAKTECIMPDLFTLSCDKTTFAWLMPTDITEKIKWQRCVINYLWEHNSIVACRIKRFIKLLLDRVKNSSDDPYLAYIAFLKAYTPSSLQDFIRYRTRSHLAWRNQAFQPQSYSITSFSPHPILAIRTAREQPYFLFIHDHGAEYYPTSKDLPHWFIRTNPQMPHIVASANNTLDICTLTEFNNRLSIIKFNGGDRIIKHYEAPVEITAQTLSDDGRLLAVGLSNSFIQILNTHNFSAYANIHSHGRFHRLFARRIANLRFSHDNNILAAVMSDGCIHFATNKPWKLGKFFHLTTQPVEAMQFTQANTHFF